MLYRIWGNLFRIRDIEKTDHYTFVTPKNDMWQYWVYITRNKDEVLSIGFASEARRIQSKLAEERKNILYLRPFLVPFDALAHKHLLEALSEATIQQLIRKNKKITNSYIQNIELFKTTL